MSSDDLGHLKMFSSQWYDEYFRRAVSSAAHAEFCERVYGKNLCQHGLMDIEELDFMVSLIEPRSSILEIGCSNGYISEYIQQRTQTEITALDYSGVAIQQAQERTKDRADVLHFHRVDLTKDEIPGNNYDTVILVDAIYFLGDYENTLARIGSKLTGTGKMLITYFEAKDEEDESTPVPGPDTTWLAKTFQKIGLDYDWYDFTRNVRAHGIRNYQVGEELKAAFEKEGNLFLYEARAAENRFFKGAAEDETIVRFMYVVRPGQSPAE